MQPFQTVSGAAVPLMRRNVDTDVIIRIEPLTQLPRHELGRHAFESLRRGKDGCPLEGVHFDEPRFREAPVLLADENFGCGSSREGAVWALQGMGVRCVIAPSFGDIFVDNCFQNGVLPIRLPRDQVLALAAACAEGAAVTVDLRESVVVAPGDLRLSFTIDATRRRALLEGLDDIGLTLTEGAAIDAWERADRAARPWNWPSSSTPDIETAQ